MNIAESTMDKEKSFDTIFHIKVFPQNKHQWAGGGEVGGVFYQATRVGRASAAVSTSTQTGRTSTRAGRRRY